MGIHDAVLDYVESELQDALIDNIPEDDAARAGVVTQGPLQGNPDPDQARISITLHENDPDVIQGASGVSALTGGWNDDIVEVECGGSVTWDRAFTIKGRCLLVNTQEDKNATRDIASTVRSRIEEALLGLSFAGVVSGDEYVSRGVISKDIVGEMVQAGGPPDAYDYFIKVRFKLQTTKGVTP